MNRNYPREKQRTTEDHHCASANLRGLQQVGRPRNGIPQGSPGAKQGYVPLFNTQRSGATDDPQANSSLLSEVRNLRVEEAKRAVQGTSRRKCTNDDIRTIDNTAEDILIKKVTVVVGHAFDWLRGTRTRPGNDVEATRNRSQSNSPMRAREAARSSS